MDLQRATPENHAKALQTIPRVGVPKTDPVMGPTGRCAAVEPKMTSLRRYGRQSRHRNLDIRPPIPSVGGFSNSRRCRAERRTLPACDEPWLEITVHPEIRAAAEWARPQRLQWRREHGR